MAKRKRSKISRGATRMREQGYTLCAVWLDAEERRVLDAAANAAGKKLATYIREQAFAIAVDSINPSTERKMSHA